MTAHLPIEEFFREIVRSEIERAAGVRVEPGPAPRHTPDFMTVSDAAKLASVSVGTVRNWLTSGKLHRCGHGRLVRISRQELMGLLEQPQRTATLPAAARAAKILGRLA